jgi:hypothetical protein
MSTGTVARDLRANDNSQISALSQFCTSEEWSGDMSTGLLKIGPQAMAFHGLQSAECGLLNLVRCYEMADRKKILELFEQATTDSSSFCFSTTIQSGTRCRQPVFCIGESSGLEKKFSGTIYGVFVFPNFTLEPGQMAAGLVFTPH